MKKFSDTALHTAECMIRTICFKTGAERYTNKWFDRRALNRVKGTKPDVDGLIWRQKTTDYKSVTTSQPPRSALRCVPLRQLLHIPFGSSSAGNTFLVCLFNVRSVGTSRRRSDISTFIQDNNIDIMLLTETWLRPAGDEAKMADLAPPGYSVLSFPRSLGGSGANGGGYHLRHKGLSQ